MKLGCGFETGCNCSGFLQGRIFEGKEPPQFVAIFQPMVILKVTFEKSNAILSNMYRLCEVN